MHTPNVRVTETDVSTYKPNHGTPSMVVSGRMGFMGERVQSFAVRTDGSPLNVPSMVVMPKTPPKVKKRFLSRKKGPVTRDIGRAYTSFDMAQLPPKDIPASFKFRTRRAAKCFFAKSPFMIGSQKQMLAVFGRPA